MRAVEGICRPRFTARILHGRGRGRPRIFKHLSPVVCGTAVRLSRRSAGRWECHSRHVGPLQAQGRVVQKGRGPRPLSKRHSARGSSAKEAHVRVPVRRGFGLPRRTRQRVRRTRCRVAGELRTAVHRRRQNFQRCERRARKEGFSPGASILLRLQRGHRLSDRVRCLRKTVESKPSVIGRHSET